MASASIQSAKPRREPQPNDLPCLTRLLLLAYAEIRIRVEKTRESPIPQGSRGANQLELNSALVGRSGGAFCCSAGARSSPS
jgi:hypothetical protein